MAEVFIVFDEPIRLRDGRRYIARVCGAPADDGRWEGWLEFEPLGDSAGAAVATSRESTQPNRTDLAYWATGLSATYLEGALARALNTDVTSLMPPQVSAVPAFDHPRRPPYHAPLASGSIARAVLDPFQVYLQGEDVLRSQLGALSEDQLRTIARDYALDLHHELPKTASRAELVAMIVVQVRDSFRASGEGRAGEQPGASEERDG